MDEIRTYREIRGEYAFNPDIMSKDDERTRRLKYIIDTKLAPADKIIILLYADCGSYRKLAKRLNVSHMTIQKVIKRIQKEILAYYEGTRNNDCDSGIVPDSADNLLLPNQPR